MALTSRFYSFSCALVILFLIDADWLSTAHAREFVVHRVAHAGGAIGNTTYTNSYDAMEASLDRGFKYFELDFSFTSDGHLVCLHDWDGSFTRSFGLPSEGPVSLLEFQRLVRQNSSYNKCTLQGLAAWLLLNPKVVVITDLKERNIEAMTVVAKTVLEFPNRIIPQVYNPEEFTHARNLGYERIIWTLYRYSGTDKNILEQVQEMSPPMAVAMPVFKTETELPAKIRRLGVPVFVHTINDAETYEKLVKEVGVSEIYTDFLRPN